MQHRHGGMSNRFTRRSWPRSDHAFGLGSIPAVIGRSWRRRAGRQTVKSKHICKCLTDQHLHLGMSLPRLTRCMTYSSHIRCPTCASLDVYGFEPTPTGQSHYCPACGKTWRVTVEDKTLDMIGASLAARRSKPRESG